MEITLSNGFVVEIKLIDIAGGKVDYRVVSGREYTGDCQSPVTITSFENAQAEITAALEEELVR